MTRRSRNTTGRRRKPRSRSAEADEVVIEILPSGNARCLYREDVDLRALGRLKLYRASWVDFRRRTQDFVVRLRDGRWLGPYRSREAAIRAEIREIQSRMLRGDRAEARVVGRAPDGWSGFAGPADTIAAGVPAQLQAPRL